MSIDQLARPDVTLGELKVRPDEFATMAAGDLLRPECSVMMGGTRVTFQEMSSRVYASVGQQTIQTPYRRVDTADKVLDHLAGNYRP